MAGTVLFASAPAQAQEWTTPSAPAEDQIACSPPANEGDSLSGSSWARDFIAIDEAHQYNQGTYSNGDPVVIAVIDTGVEATRTDVFNDRILDGFDPWTPGSKGKCDAFMHGTAVAALAAGGADGTQFIGVAPKANILPLKAYVDNSSGGDAEKASVVGSLIDDAVAHGADVINISIALPDHPNLKRAVDDAIAAGVVIVAATGNDGVNMDDPNVEADKRTFYPANYPNVIAVGGNTQDGLWYGKTNFGENLDLLAPGVNVVVPYAGGGWFADQGTSYAAPFVAGAAALLKGHFGKDTTPEWIEQRLRDTAIQPTNDFNIWQGYGVLNVGNALTASTEVINEGPSDDEATGPMENPSTIAAMDIEYDPLATEKTIAWASVGGAIVLITLVLVLRKIIPMGRTRGWRPGSRKRDQALATVEND